MLKIIMGHIVQDITDWYIFSWKARLNVYSSVMTSLPQEHHFCNKIQKDPNDTSDLCVFVKHSGVTFKNILHSSVYYQNFRRYLDFVLLLNGEEMHVPSYHRSVTSFWIDSNLGLFGQESGPVYFDGNSLLLCKMWCM